MKKNKYFLKDQEVDNLDDIRFNQNDIIKNLRMIIENNNPPYNIAVIGKWGIGKSSIINLLLNKYEKDKENYSIQRINAWKYEKESLKSVFLKQLYKGVSGKEVKTFETLKTVYNDLVLNENEYLGKEEKSKFKVVIKTMFNISLIILIFSLIVFSLYKGIQLNWNMSILIKEIFLGYCRNIGQVLLIPLLLAFISLYVSQVAKKSDKKIEVNIPIETNDDYETLIDNITKNTSKTFITVIDDLDRLSLEKIVEALDAIKAILGFKNCIFIVPFDDSILKKAIYDKRISCINSEQQVIESELILDKLFQYKIYIPPILDYDIKEYTVELVKKDIPDFINNYCKLDIFEKIIRKVLIHKNVTTPRQVKKIINTFISNIILAYDRENGNRVENGIFDNETGKIQIAKFSVLQSDFNEFYDVLFKDFNYLEKILDIYDDTSYVYENIPSDLKQFFIVKNQDDNNYEIKKEYFPLINFLKKTGHYSVKNIAPYLYLAQDNLSIKTGDENKRLITEAMSSKNSKYVKEILNKENNIDLIKYNLENIDDLEEIYNCIVTVIESFEVLSDSMKKDLSILLSERIYYVLDNNYKVTYKDFKFENVLTLYKILENKNNIQKFISSIFLDMKDDKDMDIFNISNTINILLAYDKEFNIETVDLVKNYILYEFKRKIKYLNTLLIEIDVKEKDIFDKYFSENVFNILCEYMDTENDFSNEISNIFNTYFNFLKDDDKIENNLDNIIPLFKYEAILSTLNMCFDSSICDKIEEEQVQEIVDGILEFTNDDNVNICSDIINKFQFKVNDENCDKIDVFLCNNLGNDKVQELIIKVIKAGYFSYIDDTKNEILYRMIIDDEVDVILNSIMTNIDLDSLKLLFEKLKESSGYNSTKDYSREKILYSILMKCDNKELIQEFLKFMMDNYSSYYQYKNYFYYISSIMNISGKYIETSLNETYLLIIVEGLDYYENEAILIFKSCKNISNKIMEKLVSKLIINITKDNYENRYIIMKANRNYFSEENSNLSIYKEFLVDNIQMSSDPDKVINELDESFSKIENIIDLLNLINDIEIKNYKNMYRVIAKFEDNYEIKECANDIKELLSNDNLYPHCKSILEHLKKHSFIEIYNLIYNDGINEYSDKVLLKNIIDLSYYYRNEIEKKKIIDIADLIYSNIDESELISAVTTTLQKYEHNYFDEYKDNITSILSKCYKSTSSNEIKRSIINVVKFFKITRKFKNTLDKDDLIFYLSIVK